MNADAETADAVLATLDRFNEASEKQDVDAMLAVFAEDDDVLLLGSESGEMARGRAGLREFLGRVSARSGGYRWTWEWQTVSRAGPTAWIVALGRAYAGSDRANEGVQYRVTVVLEHQKGRWVWRQFHGSEPRSSD